MSSFFYGAYGDMKEYGRNAAAAFCCFLCCGPILMIVGIASLVASFADDQGNKIDAYESAVLDWNPGSDGPAYSQDFVGQTFSMSVSPVGGATAELLVSPAPSDVRDSSVSIEVENAIMYDYNEADGAFGPSPGVRDAIQLNFFTLEL